MIPEDKQNKLEKLESFFKEAEIFAMQGEVILQGDINARIGNQYDFLSKDKYDEILGIETHDDNPPKNSEDKKTCERGLVLLDLCRSLDYLIANGRKPGDLFGKFTSMQWNGSALVDYVITKASNFSRIVELKVGDFSPCISDHCPLKYKIKLNWSKSAEVEDMIDMKSLPPRCKWNDTIKMSFIDSLSTEKIKVIFENTLTESSLTPENGISVLSSTLLECANGNSVQQNNFNKNSLVIYSEENL